MLRVFLLRVLVNKQIIEKSNYWLLDKPTARLADDNNLDKTDSEYISVAYISVYK